MSRVLQADIVVTRADGRPLLLAEVRSGGGGGEPARSQVDAYCARLLPDFALLATSSEVLIAPVDAGVVAWGRSLTLPTSKVLEAYSGGRDLTRAEGFYLASLVEAWLKDLALGWRGETPRGSDELATLGLRDALRGARVTSEVRI
jgi:hypothetical protein